MRPDMAKVVTERPRRGHHNESEKWGGRLSKDDVWREQEDDTERGGFIPWSRHRNMFAKEFSDLLGPLRGYLRKQVGRPWDKVYGELSQILDKRSLTGIHIWGHIRQDVALQADMLLIDGKLIAFERSKYGALMLPVNGLYVHPWTGLLRSQTQRVRYTFWVNRGFTQSRIDREPSVKLTDDTELRRINGIWYRCTSRKVVWRDPATWRTFQYPSGKDTHHRYFIEAKNREEVQVVDKRQLSKAQLKAYGLTNILK